MKTVKKVISKHDKVNLFTLRAAKTGLTILENILLRKALSGKYLTEKCRTEVKQQLLFKYFVKFCLMFKLLSKV